MQTTGRDESRDRDAEDDLPTPSGPAAMAMVPAAIRPEDAEDSGPMPLESS
jgi:hypothetical protein